MATYRFQPRYSEINAITNALQAIVSFTASHDFTIGQIVAFRVGKDFGMDEINNLRSKVIDITSDTITTEIDSSTWTPFTLANLNEPGTSPPVCVPSSSGVVPDSSIQMTNLEDAFDNRRV